MSARTQVIADLRASIEKIERHPVPAAPAVDGAMAAGVPQTAAGTLNEIFADNARDAGAVLGFCLMQARGLVCAERQAVIFLQMRAEAQETGLPYGPGLLGYGFDPGALALVRVDTITEMLWAMEEATGCRNVAAVIGDFASHHKALDFTVSRRLVLRAESFGVAPFLMRYGSGREASAAALRWHVMPVPSAEAPFDARAPGLPRYRVTLEKGARHLGVKATGRDGSGQDFWDLQWSENGLVADSARGQDGTGPGGRTALSGAHPAGLGDRLSQTA